MKISVYFFGAGKYPSILEFTKIKVLKWKALLIGAYPTITT